MADNKILKEKMDEIFDTDRINKVISKLDDEKRDKKVQLELVKKDIEVNTRHMKTAENQFRENETKLKELDNTIIEHLALKQQIEHIKTQINRIEDDVHKINSNKSILKINNDKINYLVNTYLINLLKEVNMNIEFETGQLEKYIINNIVKIESDMKLYKEKQQDTNRN